MDLETNVHVTMTYLVLSPNLIWFDYLVFTKTSVLTKPGYCKQILSQDINRKQLFNSSDIDNDV